MMDFLIYVPDIIVAGIVIFGIFYMCTPGGIN
jgi:hypothetical protein